MKVEFKQPQFDKVRKRFVDIPVKLEKNFSKALAKAAFLVEGMSKKRTPVDTGRLRSSIYTSIKSNYAVVQPKTDYAVYVHEGTYKMKARPFMKWGLEDSETKIKDIFGDAIKASIK